MEAATPGSQAVASLDAGFPSPFGRLHGEVLLALVPAHISTVTR
jgi:hypothetical protein